MANIHHHVLKIFFVSLETSGHIGHNCVSLPAVQTLLIVAGEATMRNSETEASNPFLGQWSWKEMEPQGLTLKA